MPLPTRSRRPLAPTALSTLAAFTALADRAAPACLAALGVLAAAASAQTPAVPAASVPPPAAHAPAATTASPAPAAPTANPAPTSAPAPFAARVRVQDAWVRMAVAGQSGTGAFMTLTAREPLTLVGVETPAAAQAEVHEMRLDAGVMRMRAIDALPLPVATPVALRPGGHHLMLMQLRGPLAVGASVPLVLLLRDSDGRTVRQNVVAPVRAAAPGPAAPAHGHGSVGGDGAQHQGHGHIPPGADSSAANPPAK